jgi:SNF2 family DNA or RNA helicase
MKTKGMSHQLEGLTRLDGKRNYAILFEQGLGKTWLTLADAERCFRANKIDALLVIAPNGVHTNWVKREIPEHLEIDNVSVFWRGMKSSKDVLAFEKLFADYKRPTLRVFTINFEAVVTKDGRIALERFLNTFRVMAVVDEGSRIKNPAAVRTKDVIAFGRKAVARRILNGTPLTQGPADLYAQFDYLKPGLLGTTSYRAFVAEFTELISAESHQMRGLMKHAGKEHLAAQIENYHKALAARKEAAKMGLPLPSLPHIDQDRFPQIPTKDSLGNKQYKNLDRLAELMAPHCFRMKKEDCLDLPPKVYTNVYFDLNKRQQKVYDDLESRHVYATDLENVSFQAIAARSKLKQVTSGFIHIRGDTDILHDDEGEREYGEDNPRMAALREYIEGIEDDAQFIIWCIYKEEITHIAKLLREMNIAACVYFGETSQANRDEAIDGFQAGKYRAFIANNAAAIGITLTAATFAIYYSFNYDLYMRLQSEDRCHRIGTRKTVTYVDLIANDTIDEHIAKNHQQKRQIIEQVIDGPTLRPHAYR